MSKTLHQFGRVLFDELEQIAVRRGGFASLKWVNEKLIEAQRDVKELGKKAAEPFVDCGSDLRLMSSVKNAGDIPTEEKHLVIVADVDNVLHFRIFDGDGKVVVDTREKGLTEEEEQIEKLRKQLGSLWPPHELTASEKERVITSVTSIVGHTLPLLRKRADKCARQARNAQVLAAQTARAVQQLGHLICDMVRTAQEVERKIKLSEQAPVLPAGFKEQDSQEQDEKATPEGQFEQSCRAAWELKDVNGLKEDDDRVPREALDALGERFNKQGVYERLIRGAVVLLSQNLDSELRKAAGAFDRVIPAFQQEAMAKQDAMVKLEAMVAEQSAAPYEIFEVVEEAARKSAMRMETVGLAFSGGGIRSATFNLGFLQGAAALGLLKQFDYLSTVSGGGYIGAWFAAWVLREGGLEPRPPTDDDVKHELAKLSADEEGKTARALLAAWLRPERGRAGDSEPPSDVDVKGERASPGANAAKAINDEARKPREPVGGRRMTEAPPNDKKKRSARKRREAIQRRGR